MRKLTLTEEVLLLLDEFILFSYRPMLKVILEMQGYDRRAALINQLGKLRREGYVRKVKRRDGVFFRITEAGKSRIQKGPVPIHKESRIWDKKWRVVIFDIPEKSYLLRDRLRQELKEWGFGMLQQSVWISPHPLFSKVEEITKKYDLERYLFFFETNHISEDDQYLAQRVWNLKETNDKYIRFLSTFKEEFEEIKKKDVEEEAIFFVRIRDAISLILYDDPQLPKELLLEDWQGFSAWKFYEKCRAYFRRKLREKVTDEDF
ncbi:MAG: PaaX family transcriptional regulator C-terminal domain-containing protein [bacterium]|nr:PaaX family transcriptional regulator C-terminal domain-containing protein [bacterium]